MDIGSTIRKYALQNAVQFKGKANPGTIVGKLMGEDPNIKSQMKEIMPQIQTIVAEVNAMNPDDQKQALGEIDPTLLEKNKKEKREFTLPDLKTNDKPVIMRFAPNPNGPLSFGHARQVMLNWWYVQKYKGTFILRFDDTDPRTKIPMKEAYDLIEQDIAWLGVHPNTVVKQSERFDLYYGFAEELIKQGKAYVDTEDAEVMRELLRKGEPSKDRDLPAEEHLKRWHMMHDPKGGYKDGQAVLRIKTDLKHKNPAVRDWPAFRIITDGKHPLKEAKVWPLLNFSSAIDDHELGVTHIIRGIDLSVSDERQQLLYEHFGWEYPQTRYTGKLLIEGIKSTSESRKLIESGELIGWDDIRLGTIMTLKRRGYTPEAIHEFVKSVGLNKNNVNVSLETVAAFNKDILDKKSDRFFFIKDPKEITINNAPTQEVALELHPEIERGKRIFHTSNAFVLDTEDVNAFKKGQLIRLMDCLNFEVQDSYEFKSLSYDDYKVNGAAIIHWLPKDETIPVTVLMPDNTSIEGLGEVRLKDLNTDTVIQLERFGFCRVDSTDPLILWYSHD